MEQVIYQSESDYFCRLKKEQSNWIDLVVDFADMISDPKMVQEDQYFIDIDILRKHIENASAEMGHFVYRGGKFLPRGNNIMKGKVVILNAPPRAGKDTIAAAICKATGAQHREFKDALYKCTAEKFGVDLEKFKELAQNGDTKDLISPLLMVDRAGIDKIHGFTGEDPTDTGEHLHCISPREALIYTSEVVYKPLYGKGYFGELAARGIDLPTGAVFSDGGFDEEILPIIEKFGMENVYVVKFTGQGVTGFYGDSRDWLNVPVDVSCLEMENDGTVEEAVDKILHWLHTCDQADEEFMLTTTGVL